MAKTFVLSDESLNCYGFRVLTSGIVLEAFKANPVMLYMHDERKVIGRWDNIRIDGTRLIAEPVFDMKDELAAKVSQQVEDGFVKGASLGFNAVEYSADSVHLIEGQQRPTVTRSIAFEASICPLPGNSNALALYNTTGQKIALDESGLIKLGLGILSTTNTIDMNKITLSAMALVALKLTEQSTPEQVEQSITAITLKASKYDDLEKQVKDEKTAAAKVKVTEAIRLKKLTEADREAYEKLAFDNPAAFDSMMSKIPGVDLPNEQIKLSNNNSPAGDRSKWTFADWNKNDASGLFQLRKDKPEEYNKLFEAYKLSLQGGAKA